MVVDELAEFARWLALFSDQGELGGAGCRSPLPWFAGRGFELSRSGISLGALFIGGGAAASLGFLLAGSLRVEVVMVIALFEMLDPVDVGPVLALTGEWPSA